MPELRLSWPDVTVVVVYVVGVRVALGWYLSRAVRAGGSEEYFLAGRSLRWPLIGLSFYVANMSGSTFVGLPGTAYADGIAVYHYEWMAAPIMVLFVLVFLPAFLRARVYTAPQYLEHRFDRRMRLVFSGFLLFANVFIDAAAALYAGATVIRVVLPGVPLEVTIVVISLMAGVYIVAGGLGAVVLNDALQALLVAVGGIVILVLTWRAIPSWDAVTAAVPARNLHLMLPADDPFLPWPGLVSGVLIIGVYFWCTNQFMIQRALGARSLEDARKGALLAGFLKLPNLFLLVLPGVMAVALFPDLERPDLVFPTLAFELLPAGLRGFMIAALAAAILSSLEAILNSAATLFTVDFVQGMRPGLDDRGLLRVGRIATIGFTLLAAAWAPQIERFPTLWQYLQSILAYITPPAVVVFLAGILWRRTDARGALAGFVGGFGIGVAGWVLNELLGVTELHYLYAAGLVFALSAILVVAVSLLGEAPAERALTTWEWVGLGSSRLPTLVLLGLCLVVVLWWW
jgi:SSS family solute:Na+ symporter